MRLTNLLLLLATVSLTFSDCKGTDTVSDPCEGLEDNELKNCLKAEKKKLKLEKKALKAEKKAKKLAKKEAKKEKQRLKREKQKLKEQKQKEKEEEQNLEPPLSNCSFPTVKVQGDILVLNDGSDRPFFVAGMTDNTTSLAMYDSKQMKKQMKNLAAMGANTMRWNAFLRGTDITWDDDGYVTGLVDGAIENLVDGLNLGFKYGIMVQIVLSSSHFLRYGSGGASGSSKQGGIEVSNELRVDRNYKMFSTADGTQAYIDNVIKPMSAAVGEHPALFGYVLVDEGNGMTLKEGSKHGTWSNVKIQYSQLLAWVNKVAGELNRQAPGVILSAPIVAKLSNWWEDGELIAAGGDPDGVLHIHQHQYYAEKHPESYSPFFHGNTVAAMAGLWGITEKPSVVGYFPIEGIPKTEKNPAAFSLESAFDALWNNGHSGGITWNYAIYSNFTDDMKMEVDDAYDHVATDLLNGLDVAEECN